MRREAAAQMDSEDRETQSLVAASAGMNALFLIAAGAVYLATKSQLVLAQGADSLLDVVAGAILVATVRVAAQPADESHPFGHQRAEPIGALVTAILAGVLAFEVFREAVTALVNDATPTMGLSVAALLGTKCAFKFLLFFYLRKRIRVSRSSALQATFVDTRNDVVATVSSLVGWFLAERGWLWADAALAIPVALYVGYSGFQLARENLRYLMGESPSDERLAEIEAEAERVDGVLEVRSVRAQFLGQELHAEVTILVAVSESATEAHDIALEVRNRLEAMEGVAEVFVHVDTRAAAKHA